MKYYSGEVTRINEREGYIVVSGVHIDADSDFLDEYYLEEGDEIRIGVDDSGDGMKASTCEYVDKEDDDDEEDYVDFDDEKDLKKYYG